MKKLILIWKIPLEVLAILISLFFLSRLLYLGPRPVCIKGIAAAMNEWMLNAGQTNGCFPNVKGNSSNSLALLDPYDGDELWRYEYIPGLNYNDPNNLVLMYLKTKTHYTWHADFDHTIFSPSRWMVLSPTIDGGTGPEGGDLVDTPELKRRILLTLEYLQEKQRPYWMTISNEQMLFLKSIN